MSYTVRSNIDNLKFFFYFEPSSFLFTGTMGSFKFKSVNSIYFMVIDNFVVVVQSMIKLISLCNICTFATASILRSCVTDLFFLSRKHLSACSINSILHINTLFAQVMLSIHSGWNRKLRFVGIGYKMYSFYNLLVLKLGYSHYIIYLLPYELSILFVGRKKRNFVLSGVNLKILSLVTTHISCLRIPNVYTGKGIRLRGTIFSRKEGKKSQF